MQLPNMGEGVSSRTFYDSGHNYELYEIVDPITKTQVYFNFDHVNKQKDVTNRPWGYSWGSPRDHSQSVSSRYGTTAHHRGRAPA